MVYSNPSESQVLELRSGGVLLTQSLHLLRPEPVSERQVLPHIGHAQGCIWYVSVAACGVPASFIFNFKTKFKVNIRVLKDPVLLYLRALNSCMLSVAGSGKTVAICCCCICFNIYFCLYRPDYVLINWFKNYVSAPRKYMFMQPAAPGGSSCQCFLSFLHLNHLIILCFASVLSPVLPSTPCRLVRTRL